MSSKIRLVKFPLEFLTQKFLGMRDELVLVEIVLPGEVFEEAEDNLDESRASGLGEES